MMDLRLNGYASIMQEQLCENPTCTSSSIESHMVTGFENTQTPAAPGAAVGCIEETDHQSYQGWWVGGGGGCYTVTCLIEY